MNDDELNLLEKLCNRANIGNPPQIATLLKFRRNLSSTGLDAPLLRCPCERLLNIVFSKESYTLPKAISIESLVKAILVSPSVYETPWSAAHRFVLYIQQDKSQHDRSVLRSNIADLQRFFLQRVATWWEEERRRTASSKLSRKRTLQPSDDDVFSGNSPRYWLLLIVSSIVKPILTIPDQSASQESLSMTDADENLSWTIPFELLSTIASVSGELDDNLRHSILDVLFQSEVRSDRILSLLKISIALKEIMRTKDWACVQMSLRTAMRTKPCIVHYQDLPVLAEAVLSLCATTLEEKKEARRWHNLMLDVMSASAAELSTYNAVETAIESSLVALPSQTVDRWASEILFTEDPKIATESSMTTSIIANLTLIVLRTHEHSGSQLVSQLVDQAFGLCPNPNDLPQQNRTNLTVQGWNFLAGLMKQDESMTCQLCSIQNETGEVTLPIISRELERIFADQTYDFQGSFRSTKSEHSNLAVVLSRFSSVVYHSILLEHANTMNVLLMRERAQSWITRANNKLLSWGEGKVSILDLVLCCLIFITVYSEFQLEEAWAIENIILEVYSTESSLLSVDSVGIAAAHGVILSKVLLSTPKTSILTKRIEKIASVFESSLNVEAFRCLVWAFIPLLSSHATLLSAAEVNLRISLQAHSSSIGATSCKSTKSKNGLMTLMALISTPEWTESTQGAWCILSNIVTENQPVIPLTLHMWLFSQLKYSISTGRFGRDVCTRLLRLCLVRLLKQIHIDENGNEYFSFGCIFMTWGGKRAQQLGDLLELFDLTFQLVKSCYGCKGVGRAEDYAAFSKCITCLPILVALQDDKMDPPEESEVMTTVAQSEINSCFIAFYCISIALRDVSSTRVSFEGMTVPSFNELRESLITVEKEERPEHFDANFSPAWLEPANTDVVALRKSTEIEDSMNRHSLWDIVVKLLLLRSNQLCESNVDRKIDDLPYTMTLAFQICCVFRKKRTLSKQLKDINFLSGIDDFGTGIETFLSSVAPAIRSLISRQKSATDANQLLSAIVDMCGSIVCSKNDTISVNRLLSLWDVYDCICQESAAIELVLFLEGCLASGQGEERVCNMQIGSPEEGIDAIVQHIRASIAQCLSMNFKCLSIRHCDPEQRSVYTSYVLKFCRGISMDLHAGLKGEGGGLTYEIFLPLANCIDCCARFLMQQEMSSTCTMSFSRESFDVICTKAAIRMEEIVCTYTIKQAGAFKMTLSLCAGTLPALVRSSKRTAMLEGSAEAVPGSFLLNESIAAASRLFCQLVCILGRKVSADSATSWHTIAGKEHLAEPDDVFDDDDSEPTERAKSCSNDWMAYFGETPAKSTERYLRLESEQAWIWSMCSILQVFETNWEESYNLLNGSGSYFASGLELAAYSTYRSAELADTLKCTCALFQRIGATKDNFPVSGELARKEVLALFITGAAKMRLFALCDRVLVVLRKVIKMVSVEILGPGMSTRTDSNSLRFVETVSCLTSWLGSQTKGVELTAGIQRWYHIEKHALAKPRQTITDGFKSESPVLKRLPNLIVRMEEISSLLLKLSEIVTLQEQKDASPNLKVVKALICSSVSRTPAVSLGTCISDKIKYLDEEQKELTNDFGLLKRKPTKQVGKRTHKTRHKKVMRSRNQVVDSFLQMDRSTGADEVLHEDDYADLEDFFVPG